VVGVRGEADGVTEGEALPVPGDWLPTGVEGETLPVGAEGDTLPVGAEAEGLVPGVVGPPGFGQPDRTASEMVPATAANIELRENAIAVLSSF
jgi:hypothetical protein